MSAPELAPLALDGLVEVTPRRFADARGFFVETWREGWLDPVGAAPLFVQDNHSYSRRRGTIRGLHFQAAPARQDKLVRVIRGAIFDVAVDIRPASPTFGRWASATLSAEAGNMLFIPKGFAHGFQTLTDDCDVVYKVSAAYDPALDRAIRWDDPRIAVEWPVVGPPILSDKDLAAPLLDELRDRL